MPKMTISQELIEWARELKNSVSTELPLLAKEILNYKAAESILEILFFSFILFYCVRELNDIIKTSDNTRKLKDNFEFGIIMLIGFLASIYYIFINILRLIKIYFAPKMYVLEYVMDLVNK